MFEWLLKLYVQFTVTVEHNAALLIASIIGSTVSVVARGDRTLWGVFASFLSGVFAGWYLSDVIHVYVPVPKEPLAAILAIMGRDLVGHIIRAGRENPLSLFNSFRTTPKQEEKKD